MIGKTQTQYLKIKGWGMGKTTLAPSSIEVEVPGNNQQLRKDDTDHSIINVYPNSGSLDKPIDIEYAIKLQLR